MHRAHYPIIITIRGLLADWFTIWVVNLFCMEGINVKTATMAKTSTKTKIAYRFQFGFQTIAANIPPRARMRKFIRSPESTDIVILIAIPEKSANFGLAPTAKATMTVNEGPNLCQIVSQELGRHMAM